MDTGVRKETLKIYMGINNITAKPVKIKDFKYKIEVIF